MTQCGLSWRAARSDLSGGDIGSIDGTTLRPALAQAASKAAMPLVRAWAHANRLGLGQRKVDDKANELPAMPKLLTLWDLPGATGTMAAMGWQEIAPAIPDQGADDALALKDKHHPL